MNAFLSLEVKEETSEIVFNSFNLNLGDVSVRSDAISNGASLKAESVEITAKAERATAKFGSKLPVGSKVQLGIRFGAKLTGSMLGVGSPAEICLSVSWLNSVTPQYYYSTFTDEGKQKYYTLTQFEVSDHTYTRPVNGSKASTSQPRQGACSPVGTNPF